MEQQAAIQRKQQVWEKDAGEEEAGGADGGGGDEQEANDDQLSIVAIGRLFVELDDLKQHEELPDEQDRRARNANHLLGDVSEGEQGDGVGGPARHWGECAAEVCWLVVRAERWRGSPGRVRLRRRRTR